MTIAAIKEYATANHGALQQIGVGAAKMAGSIVVAFIGSAHGRCTGPAALSIRKALGEVKEGISMLEKAKPGI